MQPRPTRSERASGKATTLGPASARAPGKIILAGEQFVVLGAPAVAMAINLHSKVLVRPRTNGSIEVSADIPLRFVTGQERKPLLSDARRVLQPLRLAAEATLEHIGRSSDGVDVSVDCEIPVAAGLGSSASTTVAIISGVARSQGIELERKEIFRIAFVSENFLHGNPSGVDQAACIYGGIVQFTRPSNVKPVQLEKSPLMLVCDTGIHHSTRRLVGAVVNRSRRERGIFQEHLMEIREICQGVVRALKAGDDRDLGSLMSRNHELLRQIGVSHPKLDRLVKAARSGGALGAKLTGAGGGGCIVAICKSDTARNTLARALRREGGTPYKVSMDPRGVESHPSGSVLK